MTSKLQNLFLQVGVILLLILSLSYVYRAATEPPYKFLEKNISATNPVVCGGDTLSFKVSINIIRTPVIATNYNSIWSVESNRNIISAENIFAATNGEFGIRTLIWTKNVSTSRLIKFPVPKNLQPGEYELRGAIASSYRKVDDYTVKFRVSNFCNKPSS